MSQVASHVEAWIETFMTHEIGERYDVASHVEAWIETCVCLSLYHYRMVASHVEAWIETNLMSSKRPSRRVASHVEAWIETSLSSHSGVVNVSPPMWRRGLKHNEPGCGPGWDAGRLPCGGVD